MASANMSYELPPLPDYTLKPLPPLVPWASDAILQVLLPFAGYWAVSLIFHIIDVWDLLPQYRLHTPAEVLKRNHVSRYECFRDVILQQVIQTIAGLLLSLTDEPATYGRADYDVAWYAQKIRLAQWALPVVLAAVGLNPTALASKVSASYPMAAGALNGGRYPGLTQTITLADQATVAPAFASWELTLANILYWYAVPALQFTAGVVIIDTWEYALHRSMHMNKWLYVTFHSRHHRLYVPYAYGALYNHPVEGFLLDTLGAGIAYLITGMTMRQSLWFFTCSTIKTVLDHSGYDLPWDPLHYIFPNNAAYHDIHHQSWGIKTNFSQPFFIFWDRIGGTMYKGEVQSKYERSRRAAEQKLAQEEENKTKALPAEKGANTAQTADSQPISTPRSTRKRSQSSTGNLKGLRNKVNESLHGKRANVLGVESSH
ncbi:sphinganine hydroxylase-like protein Sur2 [Trematosphaeria pertusa]|uniref:Sphinganine hydroxylase-like protein Sur2 n=1 Tax=Trematosphaeria pertusa TaxID=390896 RepID=A0A6A6HTA1_9PLEO|nr:sphinganine hydroxylase-like protein Sur2 [Trematosphaeria pertusa]KAF2241129.1 sphinganine hydroxylase-like protein Sur2 [Trematosphaeria pertusa]